MARTTAPSDSVLPPAPSGGRAAAPAIELRSLSKTYPGQSAPALADLSLEIADGEFFSLLGPSGSGKTTTLRLIAGFESADAGQILLAGNDVSATPPYRRDVNTVFQNYALFPHMNVLKNVQYPLRMRGERERGQLASRASEVLDLVGMADFTKRLPHELSGGQRQRIALARALVSRPKVLLLDEPLGALDLQLRQKMQVVLKDLQRELAITFIYVTHDQGEALAMSDRIAVMNNGVIEQCCPAREIYYRPETKFVAGFIGKSNLLECTADGDGRAVWGSVRLQTATALPAGPSAIAVRNESVRVVPQGQETDSANRFDARVRQLVFLGDAVEVVLDVHGQDLTARTSTAEVERWTAGDVVRVGIAAEDLQVLHG